MTWGETLLRWQSAKQTGILTSEGELDLSVRPPRQVGDPPQIHSDRHDDPGTPEYLSTRLHRVSPSSAAGNALLPRPAGRCLVPVCVSAWADPLQCLRKQIELLNLFLGAVEAALCSFTSGNNVGKLWAQQMCFLTPEIKWSKSVSKIFILFFTKSGVCVHGQLVGKAPSNI